MILNQYKGNNSGTTDAILTKLDCYLVMAPDGRDGRMDGQTEGRADMEKSISLRLQRGVIRIDFRHSSNDDASGRRQNLSMKPLLGTLACPTSVITPWTSKN